MLQDESENESKNNLGDESTFREIEQVVRNNNSTTIGQTPQNATPTAIVSSNSLKNNHHLSVQRANAATQIFSNTLAGISPVVAIPGKFAQFVLSGQAVFRPKLTKLEASAHAIQSLLALGQLILYTAMFFEGQECVVTTEFACKVLTVLDSFYQGTLLVGWVPAEFGQEQQNPNDANSAPGSGQHTRISSV